MLRPFAHGIMSLISVFLPPFSTAFRPGGGAFVVLCVRAGPWPLPAVHATSIRVVHKTWVQQLLAASCSGYDNRASEKVKTLGCCNFAVRLSFGVMASQDEFSLYVCVYV